MGDSILELRGRAILKFYLYSCARIATGCRMGVSDFHQVGAEATVRFHINGGHIKGAPILLTPRYSCLLLFFISHSHHRNIHLVQYATQLMETAPRHYFARPTRELPSTLSPCIDAGWAHGPETYLCVRRLMCRR